MSRFSGKIGFFENVEVSPGIWEPKIVEKQYKGDVTVNNWRNMPVQDKINSDLTISNRVSIISNPYSDSHLDCIKYVVWSGTKWEVTGIEVNRPRLILTLGGVYNDGQET